MTQHLNYQVIAAQIANQYKLSEDQKDAVELTLDLLSDYMFYRRNTTSEISFTLLRRIDEAALRQVVTNIQQVMQTKEYLPKGIVEKQPNILTRIMDTILPGKDEKKQ